MGLLGQTLVLYVVVGAGVAGAFYLSGARGAAGRWFRVVTAVPFWPLYLPILLSREGSASEERIEGPRPAPRDELDAAIALVDSELDAALGSLDGWAEDVLARENDRIRELHAAWATQADRIREMDRFLGPPESVGTGEPRGEGAPVVRDRLRSSREARRLNMDRLRRVRERAHADLIGTLAWVREVVSMIHLAKFTGAPASRAEELVAQIAAAVEGLSEVSASQRPGDLVPEEVARNDTGANEQQPIHIPLVVGGVHNHDRLPSTG
jgi:hypothetical protein